MNPGFTSGFPFGFCLICVICDASLEIVLHVNNTWLLRQGFRRAQFVAQTSGQTNEELEIRLTQISALVSRIGHLWGETR